MPLLFAQECRFLSHRPSMCFVSVHTALLIPFPLAEQALIMRKCRSRCSLCPVNGPWVPCSFAVTDAASMSKLGCWSSPVFASVSPDGSLDQRVDAYITFQTLTVFFFC